MVRGPSSNYKLWRNLCCWGRRRPKSGYVERVKEAKDEDEELSELRDILTEDETQEEDLLQGHLKPYRKSMGELTLLDGVIFYNNRIMIPKPLRKEVLDILHKAHQGTYGMYHAALHSVVWPGLKAALQGVRDACDSCNVNAPSNPKLPPRPIEDPEYPFQMISADYFNCKGKTWLIVVDRYSG